VTNGLLLQSCYGRQLAAHLSCVSHSCRLSHRLLSMKMVCVLNMLSCAPDMPPGSRTCLHNLLQVPCLLSCLPFQLRFLICRAWAVQQQQQGAWPWVHQQQAAGRVAERHSKPLHSRAQQRATAWTPAPMQYCRSSRAATARQAATCRRCAALLMGWQQHCGRIASRDPRPPHARLCTHAALSWCAAQLVVLLMCWQLLAAAQSCLSQWFLVDCCAVN
jgi:hypothetical protein